MDTINLIIGTETSVTNWQKTVRRSIGKCKLAPNGGSFFDIEDAINRLDDFPADMELSFKSDTTFEDACRRIIDAWWPLGNIYRANQPPPYDQIIVSSPSVPFIHGEEEKKTLKELGFVSGDLVILYGWRPVLAMMSGRPNPRRIPKNIEDFFDSVITDHKASYELSNWDGKYNPAPIGALLLYTEEDVELARYVRQYHTALHFMSGFDFHLYVMEYLSPSSGLSRQTARAFWSRNIPSAWCQVWSAFGMLKSKPYPAEQTYKIAQDIGVSPNRIPCLVLFHEWKKIKDDPLIIDVASPPTQFFRQLCGDVHATVQAANSAQQAGFIDRLLGHSKFSYSEFRRRLPTRWAKPRQGKPVLGRCQGSDRPATVFICHSSVDKPFVEKLAGDLRNLGLGVWLDRWEIKVGDSIINQIEAGIDENDYLAVVISPEAVSSPWVRRELNAAVIRELDERKVVVLPILYRQAEIPLLIRDKLYADFTKAYDQGLRSLVERLAPDAAQLVGTIAAVETKRTDSQ